MGRPRLERRRLGYALVNDTRISPFGYVRGGKLRMKSGDDFIELSPDELERLAAEIRALENPPRTFRLHGPAGRVVSSGA